MIGSLKRVIVSILSVMAISLALGTCSNDTPMEDLVHIIDNTEYMLYNAKSIGEISSFQFAMLDSITGCLDSKHNGFRYREGEEDYNAIMKRFDRYNIIYCRALSRFNPEMNTENGNQNKIAQVIALMKRMEHQALTAPNGFQPEGTDVLALDNDNTRSTIEEPVFPTKGEIDSVNAKLPVMVSEGTLFAKVEYDEATKVQTFNYRFTQVVDSNMITKDVINQLKANMVSAIKNSPNTCRRLNAGVTYLYVYNSVDDLKLYEITIEANDIK